MTTELHSFITALPLLSQVQITPPIAPAQLALFCFFFTCVGACVGSFLNVVIWRLPHRGREVLFLEQKGKLSLSWPPSHCPVCDSPIPFYLNIPIFSWLFLRGRCAKCRTNIPVRYPLVELSTALLFLGFYLAYFVAHWQKDIPQGDLPNAWPVYVFHVIFAAALLAGSAIDADLFIIPLSIPWFLAIVGVLGSALIGPPLIPLSFHIIPSLHFPIKPAVEQWWLAKAIIGGTFGLILANVLMWLKIMPRSFDGIEFEHQADIPAAAEKAEHAKTGSSKNSANESATEKQSGAMTPLPKLTKFTPVLIATAILLLTVGILWLTVSAETAALATIIGAILIFLLGVLPRDEDQVDVTEEVIEEISGPHVRREMIKEFIFIGIPIACAILAHWFLPLPDQHPAWLERIMGSLFGLLVGGGVIWAVRILGSLAFGKEAMGMGDAHLMAGVGAVIGAPLAVIALPGAALVGLFWAIFLKLTGKSNVLPFGPWLSIASILLLPLGYPIMALYIGLFVQ